MSLILRRISRGKWLYLDEKPEWVKAGDIPADVFTDVKTEKHCLSVFLVDDTVDAITRLVAGLATGRQNRGSFAFIVVDDEYIKSSGLKLAKCPGETPDELANSLHYNVIELTAGHLATFVNLLSNQGECDTRTWSQMQPKIVAGIHSGEIDKHKIAPSLMNDLEG